MSEPTTTMDDSKLEKPSSLERPRSTAHASTISDPTVSDEPALTRKFSLLSMLALAFTILGTWSAFAQDLSSGLLNGGPVTILWGLCLVTFCNVCVAVSLSELVSSMPTALGQAYWVFRLWPTPTGRFVSYCCAWITTFGWWTLTASQVAFMGEFLLAMKVLFDNDWTGAETGWLLFVVYLGVAVSVTLVNLIACRSDTFLPRFNNFVGVCFVGLFVLFSLALPISVATKPDLAFQPASFTFGAWINRTGWPDGIVWFAGLVQAAYGLTAFDSVVHMVEELPNPRVNAPKSIWLAVVCGAASGFVFMVICLFCIQNIDTVIDSPTGFPFIALLVDAVGPRPAAALLALFIFNGLGAATSIATTGSRMTWGFARDGGLPWHRYFARIDPSWHVPARALWLQGGIIALVGVLYLFATTVLDAILSVTTIALTVSYALPIATLLLVGRGKLPPGRFSLGRLGPVINWVGLIYCVVTTVFFLFPSDPNPAPEDMNYAIAVFGVMVVVAVAFWVVQGRKSYLATEEVEARLMHAQYLEQVLEAEHVSGAKA